MTGKKLLTANFAVLEAYGEQFLRLWSLAERYFADDPNTSLLRLRQLTELLAQHVAANVGDDVSTGEPQYELIRLLQDRGIVPREIAQLFGEIRRAGDAVNHIKALREQQPYTDTAVHIADVQGMVQRALRLTTQDYEQE